MTRQQIVALVLGAVAVFWMVGAYNRLVSLRNRIGESWARIDEALRQRQAAAEGLLAALREPLAAEAGALETWEATLAEAKRAAAVMTAKPVVEAHASAWLAAESALSAAASRVLSLLDGHAEVRDQDTVRTAAAAWRDASTRLNFARQVFNDAAEPYNAAIAIFPTRLLLPLFSFGRAGRV